MFTLKTAIDLEPLVRGAEMVAIAGSQLSPDDLGGEGRLAQDLYGSLEAFGQRFLGRAGVLATFGDCFLGGDITGDYVYAIEGIGAGIAGRYISVCSVYLDEPVKVSESSTTHVVLALEFKTTDVLLDDVSLGVAQLFARVAVPLVGQSPAVYTIA